MEQKNNPQRKQMRLRNYDYAQAGYYFITICVKDRKNILYDHDVEKNNENAGTVFVGVVNIEEIGGGSGQPPPRNLPITAGGIAQLTETGRMVLHYLQNIGKVYDSVKLDCFVIMPNHIHFIVVLKDELSLQNRGQTRAAVGSRPYERHMAPITISKIVNSFKTLTSKKYGQPLWQRNYYEHVIRDEDELLSARQYIMDNPVKWREDKYFN